MAEPKTVDPNVDPNATPPEGDNPPVEGENTIEHWSKKYGDSENEKGDLRKKLETEQAETNFWRIKAQQNIQPQPQDQSGEDFDLPEDLMDGESVKKLFTALRQSNRQDIKQEASLAKGEEQINYLVGKYGVGYEVARQILIVGYQGGANSPEQAKEIYGRQFGSLFGQTQNPPDPPPTNGDPPPANPNQIKYKVDPPTVPIGGVKGSDASKMKMPSMAEYDLMTPEEKRDLDQKIIDGKVEPDSTNVKFSITP